MELITDLVALLIALIPFIDPDLFQTGRPLFACRHQRDNLMVVLDVGSSDLSRDEQSLSIDQEVSFTPLDLLVEVKTFYPPFSVVFTD